MEFWEMVALAKAGKGGGSVPPEQISEAVDDWLEDNVDPETGYVLDSSLTMSNAAAPADKVGELKSAINDPVTGLATKAPVIIDSASGPIASFPDGADGLPIKSLMVNVKPQQDLHGYDNPWPAGGGANQWDEQYEAGGINAENGKNTSDETSHRTVNYIPVTPGNTYRFVKPSANNLYLRCYGESKNYLGFNHGGINQIPAPFTVTIPSDTYFIRFVITGDVTPGTIAVNYPSTVKTYSPYSNICPISGWTGCNIHVSLTTSGGTIYPITFPTDAGTVYGGTLTINDDGTGTLTVKMVETTFGSMSWYREGTSYRSNSVRTTIKCPIVDTDLANAMCSSFYQKGYGPISGEDNGAFAVISSGYGIQAGIIIVVASGYVDADSFKAAFADTQFVYELATPITYQLTAQQVIDTLYGTNNIWADCGDIELEYRADTKLYIQKINAPADDDMTADAQIASGKYFIIGGNLYLSTTTIPAGDTIIPGTNCTKTNLAEALNALNS